MNKEKPDRTPRREKAWGAWRVALSFVAWIGMVPLAAWLVFGWQAPQLEHAALAHLSLMARTKAEQAEHWSIERQGDAKVILDNLDFVERVDAMRHSGDADQQRIVRRYLDGVRQAYAYPAVVLLDPEAQVLIGVGEDTAYAAYAAELRKATVAQALKSGEIRRSESIAATQGNPDGNLDGMDFVVPLRRVVDGTIQPVGAVVLHLQPQRQIFPQILNWPGSMARGEVLLVQRQNGSLTYLHETQPRRSLFDPELAAALTAANGQPGVARARDHRGVEVLAAHRPIVGTNWFVVVKLDRDEVLAPLWALILWGGGGGLLAAIAIGVAMIAVWRKQQRDHQLALLSERNAALSQSETRFREMFDQAPLPYQSLDVTGQILAVNQAWLALVGYRREEVVGRSFDEFITEASLDTLQRNFLLLKQQGQIDGPVFEFVCRDGSLHLMRLKGQVVRDEAGNFLRTHCILSDITESQRAQEALMANTRFFLTMAQMSPVGIFRADVDGEWGYANERCCEILGIQAEQAAGDGWRQAVHDDDRETVVAAWESVTRGGLPFSMEFRCRRPSGEIRWLLGHTRIERDDAGMVLGHVGSLDDITERRRQEEDTRQLLAENESIWRNALVGIVHLKEMRIVSCNRRFEEIFRFEPGELTGHSMAIVHGSQEGFEAMRQRTERVLGEGGSHSEEGGFRHKTGSLFWGAMTGCLMDRERPEEGSIWICADISERRRAEQESQKLLQAVEQSPESIVITDRNARIEYVNPAFTRITGYTLEEVIGQNPRILKSGETSDAIYRDLWNTLTAGQVWRGVMQNRRKNGDLVWEEMSISPIVNESGEATHYVAVKEDVTARIQLQQQLEHHQAILEEQVAQRTAELSAALEAAKSADQAKDAFLANVSHELRTPLNAVIGMSGLAREMSTHPRQRDFLNKTIGAGQSLSKIIDDLLDLSKIVAGHLDFERATFSLRERVKRCCAVVAYRAEEKGLVLHETVAADVPDALVGDPLRLEQIMLNLLSNAIKFTAAGQVELRVQRDAEQDERVELRIEVEDSGIGMCAEDSARLFKPFSQTDASVSRKFGGTGLGLAISKRLAEMMDGAIAVDSREGQGATFTVKLWLDVGRSEDIPAIESVESTANPPSRYYGVTLLAVDDQAFNREIVEALLDAVGVKTRLAEHGQEALDILAQSSPGAFDLVLMDIQMPVMDGLTATREIRRHYPDLPVIALTAHTMAHEKELIRTVGMCDHIAKPFDASSFYRILAKWIPAERRQPPALKVVVPLQLTNALPPSIDRAEFPTEFPIEFPTEFPTIGGVNTAAGLALMMGNTVRYRHWLSSFGEEAPCQVAQIVRAASSNAVDLACSLTHALKGRVGLLGMDELHLMVSRLEAALIQGRPVDAMLDEVRRAVDAMSAEIGAALTGIESATGLAEIGVVEEVVSDRSPAALLEDWSSAPSLRGEESAASVANSLAELTGEANPFESLR